MRLYRPYIPLQIRVIVASRQLRERGFELDLHLLHSLENNFENMSSGRKLKVLLHALFKGAKVELHHRPALVNRPRNRRGNGYIPPANDPDHLIYLEEGAHDIETRVRGVGAQRSDLSQARYLKKVSRNRETRPKASRFPKALSHVKRSTGKSNFTSSTDKLTEKKKWPKRPFRRQP